MSEHDDAADADARASEHDDAGQRERALDPLRSFIVQAPAGSGKTELLIQRYLRLLATVAEPEQVVAITFTRKAAGEMRNRVMVALGDAGAGAGAPAAAPHYAATLALARAALAADRRHGWDLAEHPERMRIETLDALNASLAQRLPLLSGGIAGTSIVEDASSIYREAAQRAITSIASTNEGARHLQRIVPAVDYRIERLEQLVAELLAKREQWLELVAGSLWADSGHVQAQLDALAATRIAALEQLLRPGEREALARLASGAAARAPRPMASDSSHAAQGAREVEPWRALAALLLTKSGGWRRRWTQSEGFGADAGHERREITERAAALAARPGVLAALDGVRELPLATLGAGETAMLESLRALLLQATAELRVQFSTRRCVDFAELALGAQLALGRVDRPSDLLLAIDRRIRHILVDEFQDTSKSQLRLLELLTAGWEAGDGRTLFLVGDPMQSIYRFRNADMSLFLRTRHFGVGSVHCESLVLSENFRASPALVEWVNTTFRRIFPPHDEIESGSARFFDSAARRAATAGDGVHYHILRSTQLDDEIERIVQIVSAERAASAERSIGVLVQSRSHLVGLKRRLQGRGWLVRAVEIDALNEEPFVQDLLGLCRALTHPADRAAWLAMLRAPWCGLTWSDLECLTRDAPDATVWELMHDEHRLESLDADGRRRLIGLRDALQGALEARGSEPFVAWLERTWRALGGPDTQPGAIAADSLNQFFAVLASVIRDEDIVDPVELEGAFASPQRQADEPGAATIEIMTIHRAKGLEFDTVILSGLNRTTRRDDKQLIQWHDTIAPTGQALSIVAPIMPEGSELHDYLRRLEARRAEAERARLLYVATTRARSRLHLVAGIDQDKPATGAPLAYLWPDLELPAAPPETSREPASVYAEPELRRFAAPRALQARGPERIAEALPELIEYEWVGAAAAPIGIVVHRYLQIIADTGLASWPAERIDSCRPAIHAELELLGVDAETIAAATARVVTALERVLADPRGRWILGPRDEARSELTLGRVVDNAIVFMRLDRTFIDEGVRWIVDYKSGSHEGGDVDAFLRSEMARYRAQLEEYARAMRPLDTRPVRIGLYFPLMQAFCDWQPAL